MKRFTKNELVGLVIILICIGLVSFQNFRLALRRSRDSQRRSDMSAINSALEQYYKDFGFLPPSEDGKIKACKGDNFDQIIAELESSPEFSREKFFSAMRTCEWGVDAFVDLTEPSHPPYISTLPRDPKADEGYSYLYLSNSNRFQIYTYLEGASDEDEYREGVVARNLSCGTEICNSGRAFEKTPLDKSIEEYENELEREIREQMQ